MASPGQARSLRLWEAAPSSPPLTALPGQRAYQARHMMVLMSVTWSGTQFAAVGQNGAILTSPDGITWTDRTSGTTNGLYGITWSGTQFVAAGMSDTIVTSPDGLTWTTRTSGITNYSLYGVTWSGTQFAVVGQGGTILTSPDGITWTTRTSGTTNNFGASPGPAHSLRSLECYGYGCSPGYSTSTILTSPDGITWTARTSGTNNSLNGIAWSGTQFAAVGQMAQSSPLQTALHGHPHIGNGKCA